VPGQGKVIALSGLVNTIYGRTMAFSSTDKGTTWELIGSYSGIYSSGLHFVLSNPDIFWINGGYYKSTNGGVTITGRDTIWEALPALKALEIDQANLDKGSESTSVSQDGSIVIVSPHESHDLFRSLNSGNTWTNIGNTLPAGTAFPSYPLVIDASTYLAGCSFTVNGTWNTGGGATGIYRTENAGQSWTQVSSATPSGSPLVFNGVIYWSIFNGSDGGMITSSDGGRSWTVATSNSLNYWIEPVKLPNGLVATLTNAGFVATSTNGAPPWTTLGPAIGIGSLRGMVYDSVNKGFLVWQRNGAIRRLNVN